LKALPRRGLCAPRLSRKQPGQGSDQQQLNQNGPISDAHVLLTFNTLVGSCAQGGLDRHNQVMWKLPVLFFIPFISFVFCSFRYLFQISPKNKKQSNPTA
jgi:hypothetical protein